MNKLEQAARQALEALELHLNGCGVAIATRIAYDALREALAEPAEQEPVAWVDLEQWQSGEYDCFTSEKVADYMTPLYAAPVRTKELTDEEIAEIMKQPFNQTKYLEQFARAVIEKFKEKNK